MACLLFTQQRHVDDVNIRWSLILSRRALRWFLLLRWLAQVRSQGSQQAMLRMRLKTLLTCCVNGVHSHVSMMLRVRVEDQVNNTLINSKYISGAALL